MNRRSFVQSTAASWAAATAAQALPWAHPLQAQTGPGPARARLDGNRLTLENSAIAATWSLGNGLQIERLEDRRNHVTLTTPWPAFALDALVFTAAGKPRIEALAPQPAAACAAERLAGKQIVAEFSSGPVRVTWRGILRDGSHYIRQEVSIDAAAETAIAQVVLMDAPLPAAQVSGTAKGAPITAGNWFVGFEHPLSASSIPDGRAHCALRRQLPLEPGRPAVYSSVIGASLPGQMRRDFLDYVERERAHPYRTFLHYNSWYDLGYFTPYDVASAVDVIQAFGAQLHTQRGVTLDSFLFDDGWDDHKLWGFNSGFPDGFTPLTVAAAAIGAAPGVWLSPWGGYSKPRQERLDYAKQAGFETNRSGLALSGPVYYRRFREVCLQMISRYGINQFKLDGTGSNATVVPGSAFGSDFEAAIALIGDLRAAKPDLFINLTTGTYPSPFWLRYADSIWRGGEDHSFAGVGTDRQQWITYRDADTYQHVVQAGPLFPLNSLMLHGIIYASSANKLNVDPQHDFDAEVRAYFGTGTQLQEMYITHSLLAPDDWNVLAEAAQWSRRNAAILRDTHWIGGNPKALEVYGHAALAGRRAIVTLRNPSDQPQSYDLEVASTLELPATAPRRWTASCPWKRDQWRQPLAPLHLELHAGTAHPVPLRPFEVLTLELAG